MNFICYNVENIVKGGAKVKKFYYIFFICLVLISLAACGSSNTSDFSANYSSLPPEEWVWYEDGAYEVGTDIPEGQYYQKAQGDHAFLKITNQGSEGTIVSPTFLFFSITEGETLEIMNGAVTLASNIPPIEERGTGMYRVGFDLPAGKYQIRPVGKEEGFYSLVDHPLELDSQDFLAIDYFSQPSYLILSEGQYLKLSDAEILELSAGSEDIWYISGVYQVGKDLPAGDYYIEIEASPEDTASTYLYVLYPDGSLSDNTAIRTSGGDTFGFLSVKDGQYLKIIGGRMISASNISPVESTGNGMYRVGVDLPAGEYTLRSTKEKGGRAAVLTDLSFSEESTRFHQQFTGEIVVTVEEGEYLEFYNAEIVSK